VSGIVPGREPAFELPHRSASGRADFLVSASHLAALAAIDAWPDWPAGAVALYGPAQCGKTHLLHLWQAKSAGRMLAGATLTMADFAADGAPVVAVDDADAAPEEALLHLCNWCREQGGSLFLAARMPPAQWSTALADLASRLRALPAIAIEPPGEALLGAIFVKHFSDRQLRVPPEVIAYLVPRVERSFAAVAAVAAGLDRASLAAGRPITVPLAREILTALGRSA
jgi:chromosomal replication initiation ATPase DnaA